MEKDIHTRIEDDPGVMHKVQGDVVPKSLEVPRRGDHVAVARGIVNKKPMQILEGA
jgi:hypothetical protein